MHYHRISSRRPGLVPGRLIACAALAMLVTGLNAQSTSQVIQLSTRMPVGVGDQVGIGGFIVTGTSPKSVIVRGVGPTLAQSGIPGALADPVLELHGPSGFATITNDNWRDTQEQQIQGAGLAPTSTLEPAIWAVLSPGAYTVILRGNNNTTGTALVEVYDLNPAPDSKLANLSTRAFCDVNADIIIAGLMIGNGGASDRIVVRGIGPSLVPAVANVMANPVLELRNNNGTLLGSNNDWQDNPVQAQQ
ncbi:MAG: hypothetical protein WAO00_15935, partial [Chthoniobacterales bacterium]